MGSVFKDTGYGNLMAHFNGFKVSYNPDTRRLGPFWAGDGAETALILDGRYYVLNGDFRQEYVVLAEEGPEAAKAFFDGKPELKSDWSE